MSVADKTSFNVKKKMAHQTIRKRPRQRRTCRRTLCDIPFPDKGTRSF